MLVKARIYDPDHWEDGFFVQFNPNTLTYAAGVNEGADKGVQNAESTAHERQRQGDPTGRTGSSSLTVNLFFHSYVSEHVYGDVRLDINRLRAFLRHTGSDGQVSSRKIAFAWGSITQIGTLESLNAVYQMFAWDGTPVQAEATIVICGEDPDVTAALAEQEAAAALVQDAARAAGSLMKDISWLF